jgi:hypothetical protein
MSTELIRQVSASADDGYISSSGSFNNTNAYLVIGRYESYTKAFARLLNITIPHGATIDSAVISVAAYATDSATPVYTRIHFNDIDDVTATPTSAAEYNALDLTTAYVDWSMPAFSQYTWYDSPDIKTVLQEIIDRDGWESGNDIMLMVLDNGSAAYHMKQPYTYDGDSGGGLKLTINYTNPVLGQFMTTNRGYW